MSNSNSIAKQHSDSGSGGNVAGSRTEIFAWAMYDWANSAYSTISITILMGYIVNIVVPGKLGTVVWAWGIGVSMLVAAVLSPIVGAVADANRSKRRWLAFTALSGSGTAMVLSLVPPTMSWVVVGLFVLMCFFFEISLGFYNGFLPEIADEQSMNRVSAWGYTLGYLGGTLALLMALAVKIKGAEWGIVDVSSQLRVGIFILGAWWGVFTLPTIWILRDRGDRDHTRLPLGKAVQNAVGRTADTIRHLRRYHMLAIFLAGFLLYNDGIQTVISQASVVADKVIGFEMQELIYLILMIQVVAMPGAMFVGFLADRLGQKRTLMGCLAIWVGLVVCAYFVTSKFQFWMMGVVLALVLGGTQSVSRAMMGMMTPESRAAEFFGFFNLSGKATSFMGVFLFGLITWMTGDMRMSMLSLLVFFIFGWAIVSFVDIERGRQQAMEDDRI
ncbi:MAG: MFS transporter [Pirellulales bacterium]|nr:MFS transporter [Pirellulales bacterium]